MTANRESTMISPEMARALATMTYVGPTRALTFRAGTMKAMVRRGWVETRPAREWGPGAVRYHLTDAGRAAAEASPACREWLEKWTSR
jgi:hypothetical protein